MKTQKRKRYINVVLALNRLNAQLFEAEKHLHKEEAKTDAHTVVNTELHSEEISPEQRIDEIKKQIEHCRQEMQDLLT